MCIIVKKIFFHFEIKWCKSTKAFFLMCQVWWITPYDYFSDDTRLCSQWWFILFILKVAATVTIAFDSEIENVFNIVTTIHVYLFIGYHNSFPLLLMYACLYIAESLPFQVIKQQIKINFSNWCHFIWNLKIQIFLVVYFILQFLGDRKKKKNLCTEDDVSLLRIVTSCKGNIS